MELARDMAPTTAALMPDVHRLARAAIPMAPVLGMAVTNAVTALIVLNVAKAAILAGPAQDMEPIIVGLTRFVHQISKADIRMVLVPVMAQTIASSETK